jgi:hypothetical protein
MTQSLWEANGAVNGLIGQVSGGRNLYEGDTATEIPIRA